MNTSQVGQITLAYVQAALILLEKQFLVPYGDYKRYDLVIEEFDGSFNRVQCKTGRIIRGAIYFPTSSTVARSRSGKKTVRTPYRGELFGVFCPDNGKVYLVPADEVPMTAAWLRLEPPRNKQNARIKWAQPYEIASFGAVAKLGSRLNGIQEIAGSNPAGSIQTRASDLSEALVIYSLA
jgi:PD-(D/E)XK endonuclease